MLTILMLFALACAKEPQPTVSDDSSSPEVVREEIEDRADPEIEAQLQDLRETVKVLHGPEAVDDILEQRAAAREEAVEEVAAELAAADAAEAKAKAKAEVEATAAEAELRQRVEQAKR